MADQLRQGQNQDVTLHRGFVDPSATRQREQLLRAPHDILVGERGCRVDAVHHRIGAISVEQLVEKAAAERLFGELAQQVLQDEAALCRVREDRAALEAREARGQEHVAPLHLDRRAAAVRLEPPGRRLHFLLELRHQHDPPRRGTEQPARHGVAHQAAPSEQHYRPITQFHAVARWPRPRARRAAGTCLPRACPAGPGRRPHGAATQP